MTHQAAPPEDARHRFGIPLRTALIALVAVGAVIGGGAALGIGTRGSPVSSSQAPSLTTPAVPTGNTIGEQDYLDALLNGHIVFGSSAVAIAVGDDVCSQLRAGDVPRLAAQPPSRLDETQYDLIVTAARTSLC